jgi:hypothetical protein
MHRKHRMPLREKAFIASLRYHGFRITTRKHNLKRAYGYVIPATDKEDMYGTDLWVKMPKDQQLIGVQLTQRGVRIYRKFYNPNQDQLQAFISRTEERLRLKKTLCQIRGIVFILIKDHLHENSHELLAHSDVKALRKAVTKLNRSPNFG